MKNETRQASGDNLLGSRVPTVEEIAAKMYLCRATARRLDGWDKIIPCMKELLQKKADQNKTGVLEAMMEILNMNGDDPVAALWLLAAAVEIIEPSPNK